jgi:hypothetical protein
VRERLSGLRTLHHGESGLAVPLRPSSPKLPQGSRFPHIGHQQKAPAGRAGGKVTYGTDTVMEPRRGPARIAHLAR